MARTEPLPARPPASPVDAGSIVIPAHNEERVIGPLLTALGGWDGEVVVVANGCTDGTADLARSMGVRVVETPVPSKIRALALGDSHVSRFPRFYVDADVVLGADDVPALSGALAEPGVHAAGPERLLVMDGVGRAVRAYYDVWTRLPGVRTELYGRGVIAVDEAGHRRLAHWREAVSDDLAAAMSFAPAELRVLAEAQVLIRPPRRYTDLLRRRIRAATGNAALHRDPRAPRVRGSGASLGELARLVRREPALLPPAAVFLVTALLARLGARWVRVRGSTTWLRDESSRLPTPRTTPGAVSAAPHLASEQ